MAGVINGGSHRGRGAWRSRLKPNSDINITPMVDVMLVLLIIFMVTAPLLTRGRRRRSAEDQGEALEPRQRAADRLDRKERQDFPRRRETEIEAVSLEDWRRR